MVGYRPGLDVSSLGENEAVALCRISDSSGIDDIVQFPGGFSVDLYVLSLSAGYCSRTDLLQRNWILTDSFLSHPPHAPLRASSGSSHVCESEHRVCLHPCI